MSARALLSELKARGVKLALRDRDLVLRGRPGAWDDLKDRLRAGKDALMALLSEGDAIFWRDTFAERAAILEYDAGLDRKAAEARALDLLVPEWLALNVAADPGPYHCVACGAVTQPTDTAIDYGGVERSVHRRCHQAFVVERKALATATLSALVGFGGVQPAESVQRTASLTPKSASPVARKTRPEDEWYSPPEMVDPARGTMGGIDLDPASCEKANEVVRATTFYTDEDDGLSKEWKGRTYLNPPYSRRRCRQFTEKLVRHVRDKSVTAAILVLHNATDTKVFQSMLDAADAICFVRGRISFWHPDKPSGKPPTGHVVFYFGPNVGRFVREFGRFGKVVDLRRAAVPSQSLVGAESAT